MKRAIMIALITKIFAVITLCREVPGFLHNHVMADACGDSGMAGHFPGI